MDDRFYFRQLLSGRDFAKRNSLAIQMVNFAYLVGDRETGEALVVDPAYDPAGIVEIAEEDGMTITGVLATHFHPDHVGGDLMGHTISGIADLLEVIDVPIHVQAPEADLVAQVTGVEPGHLVSHASSDVVSAGAVDVELIHTPGHTPGSQCFMVGGALLAGDTLFLQGCGRMDLPGSDPAEMYESLTQKLAKVPDDAVLYPGHRYSPEPSATMGHTRATNQVFVPKTAESWLTVFGR